MSESSQPIGTSKAWSAAKLAAYAVTAPILGAPAFVAGCVETGKLFPEAKPTTDRLAQGICDFTDKLLPGAGKLVAKTQGLQAAPPPEAAHDRAHGSNARHAGQSV